MAPAAFSWRLCVTTFLLCSLLLFPFFVVVIFAFFTLALFSFLLNINQLEIRA